MAVLPRCILAFSGGLDTSLCVVYLRETLGYEVVTATVDTGAFDADELARIEQRSVVGRSARRGHRFVCRVRLALGGNLQSHA